MTKERIIATAKELFQQVGLKNATMDDIAKQAGISKRTIYENFKDKEEILVACIENHVAENKCFAKGVFEKSDNVLEAVLVLVKQGSELAQAHKFILMEEIKRYYPAVHKNLVVGYGDEKIKGMTDFIKKGMNEGVFRKDMNPEIVAVILHRQQESISLNNRNLETFSFLEIFENMVVFYLRGLCTPKGLTILEKTLAKGRLVYHRNTVNI
ncbi:MAG: TetR/AcrR family transcriptional regulator [Bacteroidales bacterium]|nr:TetR/AcrR family transcriptional regulator [Bacteroidales bacterium]